MRAILLVFDQPEEHEYKRIRILDSFVKNIFRPLNQIKENLGYVVRGFLHKINTKKSTCNCVRNGAFQKAKILIKYLRKEMGLPKEKITLLRTSKFHTGESAENTLRSLILESPDEDLVLFFAGHGGVGDWYLGSFCGEKVYVRYFALKNILNSFRGRLILFNECCHALALDRFLKNLRGRYLLFGASRSRNFGDAFISPIGAICDSWRKRLIAKPKVGKVEVIISPDNRISGRLDVAAGQSRVSKLPFRTCTCGDIVLATIPEDGENPPLLRSGSELDDLCFPKPA